MTDTGPGAHVAGISTSSMTDTDPGAHVAGISTSSMTDTDPGAHVAGISTSSMTDTDPGAHVAGISISSMTDTDPGAQGPVVELVETSQPGAGSLGPVVELVETAQPGSTPGPSGPRSPYATAGAPPDGCDWPPGMCHVHHDPPRSQGGVSDIDHAWMLCPHHHTRGRDPTYDVSTLPDGQITFHRRT